MFAFSVGKGPFDSFRILNLSKHLLALVSRALQDGLNTFQAFNRCMGDSSRHIRAGWRKNLVAGRRYVTVPCACRNFGYSATVNAEPRRNIMLPVAAPQHSFYKGRISARQTNSTCVSSIHRHQTQKMSHRIGGIPAERY
ncbi:hypothetical protein JQ637_15975 [Bradyrhizobium diazoefficiens]|uniref:hypothetical protein n=1 Tax=Bradyrhizobium diazoefficiens TaxID=1355477 RepID=UPI001B8C9251|nr:hypothetical protein [Bradyrhizobium diazoefficiens]MBR0887844.1 hypothetical protein [Bradyrhizobium diazoefficiens]